MLRWKGGAITTKIQRRKCEASLIGQLAECIYRLDKQILTSVRVRYGLDQAEWAIAVALCRTSSSSL